MQVRHGTLRCLCRRYDSGNQRKRRRKQRSKIYIDQREIEFVSFFFFSRLILFAGSNQLQSFGRECQPRQTIAGSTRNVFFILKVWNSLKSAWINLRYILGWAQRKRRVRRTLQRPAVQTQRCKKIEKVQTSCKKLQFVSNQKKIRQGIAKDQNYLPKQRRKTTPLRTRRLVFRFCVSGFGHCSILNNN